jgi:hypothetical protein
LIGLAGSHVGKGRPVRAGVVHSPTTNSNPDSKIWLLLLECSDTAVTRSGAWIHVLDVKCFRVDKSKSKVDVCPVAQWDILGFHVTTWPLIVPALVIADGAFIRGPLREIASRVWHRVWATKVDCRAAEAVLTAAHVERASGQIRILSTPIFGVTFRFAFAVARAFGAAKNRAKATGTSTRIITMMFVNL